ncbi:restriction endonuclease subunit S [Arthrobacter sp. LAPM80]|uniref:restriction endonuclease subunit S n=1 Tax=Arthrobacter sp. LAPM80 TaxID=3141788 RepID=UPI00398BA960
MSRFPSVKLSQVATVRSGFAFKSADWRAAGVPVIKIRNVTPGNVVLENCGFVSEDVAASAVAFEAQFGDSLISMSGATVGEIGRVRFDQRALVNQRVGAFRVTFPTHLDSNYLYQFLQLPDTVDYFTSSAYGSAQPNISPSLILNIDIPLPPIQEQRAIAEVLGALDDKIAANTKLAETSLELTKTLFHKSILDVEFSDKSFADVAKVSGGGTPSTKVPEYWGGDTNWATPTDVTALRGPYLEATSRPITTEGLAACSSDLFQSGAILMTSRATIGAFAIAQVPTAVNQGFIVVEPNEPSMRYWLFHEMLSRVDEFISLANGATFLELSRGNFKKFKVRLAGSETMQSFEAKAIPLHSVAQNALKENSTLAATRDALLPQLMSGKLCVKDAEALVSAAV